MCVHDSLGLPIVWWWNMSDIPFYCITKYDDQDIKFITFVSGEQMNEWPLPSEYNFSLTLSVIQSLPSVSVTLHFPKIAVRVPFALILL